MSLRICISNCPRLSLQSMTRSCFARSGPLQQLFPHLSYFLMHFDTSPPVLSQLSSRLRADPRVVKWTTLKLGEKLHEITPPGTSAGLRDLGRIENVGLTSSLSSSSKTVMGSKTIS